MFDATVTDGVLQVTQPGARWLSSGWDGGFHDTDVAYNISVPEGWERTDLTEYVGERRKRAGFVSSGPALLTGVDLGHLQGARDRSVVVYATAGVSNPAALPMNPVKRRRNGSMDGDNGVSDSPVGTVNVIVGTTHALSEGALTNLLGVVVEAKTATLLAETGFTGTTTDAVIAGTVTSGEETTFTGSATAIGASTRVCVREAVQASLTSRYADRELPASVDDAKYGTITDRRAEVFTP
ncbi:MULTISPECIES: adenosylcobinamide amidohydrolase [unclassified Haladaptatus]|uniref:adenosylcobinamide amidohydrolase n=1 Tax=unclassified Haladaptatus TaxID=2622732 RepID=UPI00209C5D6B|nr:MULTISPECIES: adenosylcobinamide amidohydrolase [unclassified Haladaptatus]MCO8245459.1 adenosylcobinamide amidohydrolase [Haladaptatus sp. AB643]MCO8256571.1 adenosylcobinamide amidohydrolase [Haladaptatus sp. AB618]